MLVLSYYLNPIRVNFNSIELDTGNTDMFGEINFQLVESSLLLGIEELLDRCGNSNYNLFDH
jgi:hypothetical protein